VHWAGTCKEAGKCRSCLLLVSIIVLLVMLLLLLVKGVLGVLHLEACGTTSTQIVGKPAGDGPGQAVNVSGGQC
jgi:hypothetical protein